MKLGLDLLVISLGGACGAVLRYAVNLAATKFFIGNFPWGTLIANLTGCLLVGMLIGSGYDQKNELLRLGFAVGLLGSLTTFSTFSAETVKHAMAGNWGIALVNVIMNLSVCLIAVAIGIQTAKRIWT